MAPQPRQRPLVLIDQKPDTVFIEFSMNDAATTLNISRDQARANLTSMVNGIKSAHPACEIILQIMNPVDRRDGDSYSPRPELALYQQDCRDFAASNALQCIDHMPAFTALLDEGSDTYRGFVPDGVHPSAEGFARYLTPVLVQAIGLNAGIVQEPSLVIDNSDPDPAVVFNGSWTPSTTTAGYLGVDYRHNGNAGQGSKSVVFTPNIPSAGIYPIFLRWTSEANRASNVPVTVNYNGGSQVVTVNQRSSGGTWVSLGSFPFAAGSSGTVTIGTTATDGYVIVDALGVGLNMPVPAIRLRMDNARAAEPAAPDGAARPSSIIVWRSGPAAGDLTVPLDYTGGSAASGVDYAHLPASITIPAGQSSGAVELLPLYDLPSEGDETFKVSLKPVEGYTLDYPRRASIVIEDRVDGGANILIDEPFGGSGGALHGKTANTHAPAIITAGGSATWVAAPSFLDNGVVSLATRQGASLNLGTYINAAKGTALGKFKLTMTVGPTSGAWISLGFAAETTPNLSKDFTNTGSGSAATTGLGTIIYRAVSNPGELDMFGGGGNANPFFRVRAYGEARDTAGKVTARAWCEAFIQRGAAYVDPSDKPETRFGSLTKTSNQNFGRRFDLVSFRWLAPDEI
jgi:hypothetical protein